jgi:hypothetical protein
MIQLGTEWVQVAEEFQRIQKQLIYQSKQSEWNEERKGMVGPAS